MKYAKWLLEDIELAIKEIKQNKVASPLAILERIRDRLQR